MPAKYAREVLTKENEFLDALIATATTYSQNSQGLAVELFNGWVKGLTRHRDVNTELIDASDSAFDEEVKEEIGLLQGVVQTIKGGGNVTHSWVDHLADDIGFLKKLL